MTDKSSLDDDNNPESAVGWFNGGIVTITPEEHMEMAAKRNSIEAADDEDEDDISDLDELDEIV